MVRLSGHEALLRVNFQLHTWRRSQQRPGSLTGIAFSANHRVRLDPTPFNDPLQIVHQEVFGELLKRKQRIQRQPESFGTTGSRNLLKGAWRVHCFLLHARELGTAEQSAIASPQAIGEERPQKRSSPVPVREARELP